MASPVDTYKEALAALPASVRNALLDSGTPGPAGLVDYLAYLRAKDQENQPFFWNGVSEGGTTGPAIGAGGTVSGLGVPGTMSNDVNNAAIAGVTGQQALGLAQAAMNPVGAVVGAVVGSAQGKDVSPLSISGNMLDMNNEDTQQGINNAIAAIDQQTQAAIAQAIDAASQDVGETGQDAATAGANAASGEGIGVKRGGLIKHWAGGGFVDGMGGGLDDAVQAMIGGEEPAALSDGEYVLPADVVSALGDGSSKAGAKRLEGIVAAIRKHKYGRDRQPPRMTKGLMAMLRA